MRFLNFWSYNPGQKISGNFLKLSSKHNVLTLFWRLGSVSVDRPAPQAMLIVNTTIWTTLNLGKWKIESRVILASVSHIFYQGCRYRSCVWYDVFSIARFHVTSRRPYWCPKTKKRRPYWCTKSILRKFHCIFIQTSSSVYYTNLAACRVSENAQWKNCWGGL